MSLFKQYLESENKFSKINDSRLINIFKKNRDQLNRKRQKVRPWLKIANEVLQRSLDEINNNDFDKDKENRLLDFLSKVINIENLKKEIKGKGIKERIIGLIERNNKILNSKNSSELDKLLKDQYENNELIENYNSVKEEMNRRGLQK